MASTLGSVKELKISSENVNGLQIRSIGICEVKCTLNLGNVFPIIYCYVLIREYVFTKPIITQELNQICFRESIL